MLTEYLYIDHRRLDSYIEQIAPPVVYDKIPVWKAELSITGPKAMASQDRPSRSRTNHEKIRLLSEYLHNNQQIAAPSLGGSLTYYSENQPFAEEVCIAKRNSSVAANV